MKGHKNFTEQNFSVPENGDIGHFSDLALHGPSGPVLTIQQGLLLAFTRVQVIITEWPMADTGGSLAVTYHHVTDKGGPLAVPRDPLASTVGHLSKTGGPLAGTRGHWGGERVSS